MEKDTHIKNWDKKDRKIPDWGYFLFFLRTY
jgi:hypothetical protein